MKIAFFGVCRKAGTTLHTRTIAAALRLCGHETIQICSDPRIFIHSSGNDFSLIDCSAFPESVSVGIMAAADLIIVNATQTGEGVARFMQKNHRILSRIRILIGRYSPGFESLHRQWLMNYRLEPLEIGRIPYSRSLLQAVMEGTETEFLKHVLAEQVHFYRERLLIQAVFQLLRVIEEIEGEGIWKKFLNSMDPQLSQYWRFSQLLES